MPLGVFFGGVWDRRCEYPKRATLIARLRSTAETMAMPCADVYHIDPYFLR